MPVALTLLQIDIETEFYFFLSKNVQLLGLMFWWAWQCTDENNAFQFNIYICLENSSTPMIF